MLKWSIGALCTAIVSCLPGTVAAETKVALELVLAVDSSTSVTDEESKLQHSGYVQAFYDKEVVAAIRALGQGGIAVTYVQWSSHRHQVQTVKWTHVFDDASSRAFGDAVQRNSRRIEGAATAIGDAVIYSAGLFANNGFVAERKVVDVSADDRYNAGSAPSYARGIAIKNKVTVNGLAIDETGVLADYFRDHVITGDGSFVTAANSFEDFAAAIKQKLLRELESPAKLVEFTSDARKRRR